MIVVRTQREIADYLWCSEEYIHAVKKGKRKLSKNKRDRLRKFYASKIYEMAPLAYYIPEWYDYSVDVSVGKK